MSAREEEDGDLAVEWIGQGAPIPPRLFLPSTPFHERNEIRQQISAAMPRPEGMAATFDSLDVFAQLTQSQYLKQLYGFGYYKKQGPEFTLSRMACLEGSMVREFLALLLLKESFLPIVQDWQGKWDRFRSGDGHRPFGEFVREYKIFPGVAKNVPLRIRFAKLFRWDQFSLRDSFGRPICESARWSDIYECLSGLGDVAADGSVESKRVKMGDDRPAKAYTLLVSSHNHSLDFDFRLNMPEVVKQSCFLRMVVEPPEVFVVGDAEGKFFLDPPQKLVWIAMRHEFENPSVVEEDCKRLVKDAVIAGDAILSMVDGKAPMGGYPDGEDVGEDDREWHIDQWMRDKMRVFAIDINSTVASLAARDESHPFTLFVGDFLRKHAARVCDSTSQEIEAEFAERVFVKGVVPLVLAEREYIRRRQQVDASITVEAIEREWVTQVREARLKGMHEALRDFKANYRPLSAAANADKWAKRSYQIHWFERVASRYRRGLNNRLKALLSDYLSNTVLFSRKHCFGVKDCCLLWRQVKKIILDQPDAPRVSDVNENVGSAEDCTVSNLSAMRLELCRSVHSMMDALWGCAVTAEIPMAFLDFLQDVDDSENDPSREPQSDDEDQDESLS